MKFPSRRRRRRSWPRIVSLLVSCVLPLAARSIDAADVYALQNAKIVTGTGTTIEKGTLVIRDGLIAAIGANVSIPPEAKVIDAAGLTLYPGLIDSHSTLGFAGGASQEITPADLQQLREFRNLVGQFGQDTSLLTKVINALQATPAGPTPPGPPAAATESSSRRGLEPELTAASLIRPGGAAIENAQALGFTSALAVPSEGIFQGQSALINLAGEDGSSMVVKSPVALNIAFQPRRGGYPSTQMGILAFLRQSFYDAQRYKIWNELYTKKKRGIPRPPADPSSAALMPVLEGRLPVIFTVNREDEIKRAISLVEEFKLKAILSGANEVSAVTPTLKSKNIPVLVSLNLASPRTGAAEEFGGGGFGVAAASRTSEDFINNILSLQKSGVKFAFQTSGISRPQDVIDSIQRLIEKGFPKEEALKALTIYPTQIFGVDEQLGSLEVGKIANIMALTGEVFGRDTKLKYLFIDGKRIDVKPLTSPTPAAPRGRRPSEVNDEY